MKKARRDAEGATFSGDPKGSASDARRSGRARWCAMIVLFGGSICLANSTVDVLRIDGSKLTCSFLGTTDETILLECPDRTTLPIDSVHVMSFQTGQRHLRTPNHAATIFPASGGRISATIVGENDEAVVADTAIGSQLNLPLASLAGVWFHKSDANSKARALFDELAGKDVLLIERDGKLSTIRGGVLTLGPNGGRFMLNRKERAFQLDNVAGIVFATGVGSDDTWPATVRLADGGEFVGRLLQADPTTMTFATSMGADVTLPLAAVSEARFRSERVVYLSDLRPARTKTAGMLHEASPPRFDRSVANIPLSIDGVRYDRGIGVQSKTELVYAIDGAYDSFAATIGIDDAVRPRGDVVFRIEGDSRVLFDSGSVTGRDGPKQVTLDVTGIRELALIVDFGEGMDVSDHADWADARLIKPPL